MNSTETNYLMSSIESGSITLLDPNCPISPNENNSNHLTGCFQTFKKTYIEPNQSVIFVFEGSIGIFFTVTFTLAWCLLGQKSKGNRVGTKYASQAKDFGNENLYSMNATRTSQNATRTIFSNPWELSPPKNANGKSRNPFGSKQNADNSELDSGEPERVYTYGKLVRVAYPYKQKKEIL